jgi:hypothetical protein
MRITVKRLAKLFLFCLVPGFLVSLLGQTMPRSGAMRHCSAISRIA